MIKLVKGTFQNELETKKKLCEFIMGADILSMNEQCKAFESEFGKYQKVNHCILVNSGSSANLVLIQALLNLGRLQIGDKIGVSALTWATNVMPLLQLGLDPVFIDCELDSLNISPQTLKPHLKDIKCLFITNVLGLSDDMPAINILCTENNIMLLEDNCESLGSVYKGRKLGNFGLGSTFSFFVGHHLSTVEGGMVCTPDKELADMVRMVRAHGWDRNLDPEKQQELRDEHLIDDFNAKYTFYDLAYNVRPTEITGFLGVDQLKYIPKNTVIRHNTFVKFREATKLNKNIITIKVFLDVVSNMAFPIVCNTEAAAEYYKNLFTECNIELRPLIAGNMATQPFMMKYKAPNWDMPNADFIHRCGFYIPNYPELTKEEVQLICDILKST